MKGATIGHVLRRLRAQISIHAPVKGATLTRTPGGTYHDDFNPRSREGSDKNSLDGVTRLRDFNPRSREGSDLLSPGA